MSSPKSWSGESTCRCENHPISCHHVTSPLGDFHDRMWFPLCNILNERVCDTQDSLGDKKILMVLIIRPMVLPMNNFFLPHFAQEE